MQTLSVVMFLLGAAGCILAVPWWLQNALHGLFLSYGMSPSTAQGWSILSTMTTVVGWFLTAGIASFEADEREQKKRDIERAKNMYR